MVQRLQADNLDSAAKQLLGVTVWAVDNRWLLRADTHSTSDGAMVL